MGIQWLVKPFEALNLAEWHDLLQLRINVFVVEQNCPYPELDGLDARCIHVAGIEKGKVVAVARIVPPGVSYPEVSIGRVATHASKRGSGIGKLLMQKCIEAVEEKFGRAPIRISAQTYLLKFYHNLGFESTGKDYLEDGIPHTEMLRKAPNHQ